MRSASHDRKERSNEYGGKLPADDLMRHALACLASDSMVNVVDGIAVLTDKGRQAV